MPENWSNVLCEPLPILLNFLKYPISIHPNLENGYLSKEMRTKIKGDISRLGSTVLYYITSYAPKHNKSKFKVVTHQSTFALMSKGR
jgi:hypothetical protein